MASIETLYKDKEKTEQLYPRTKTSAVTDNNGVTVETLINNKQDRLVSGENIKTINGESILGNGNIEVQGASSWNELSDKPFVAVDSTTLKVEQNTLKVNTTNNAEEDNTQPITSAGVYTIVGNIDALLDTI